VLHVAYKAFVLVVLRSSTQTVYLIQSSHLSSRARLALLVFAFDLHSFPSPSACALFLHLRLPLPIILGYGAKMSLATVLSARKHTFKFLQANVNGKRAAQRELLERGARFEKWDLILIQEASRRTRELDEFPYGYYLVQCAPLHEDTGRHISTCVYANIDR